MASAKKDYLTGSLASASAPPKRPPKTPWGHVRASLSGACLEFDPKSAQEWQQWRDENLEELEFPKEGFDHIYGQNLISQVDSVNLGEDEVDDDGGAMSAFLHSQNMGSTKSPLDAPIGSLREKWRMLPYFLALRGLLRQHIDSFNHFVHVEMKQIVQSPSNSEIRSEHDPKFYLR